MMRGMKKALLALTLVMLAIPAIVEARAVHNFGCGECHKSGVSFSDFAVNNVCISCHSASSPRNLQLVAGGQSNIQGLFDAADASNAMGANTASPHSQSSHMWGGTDSRPAAGAQPPTLYASAFNGRYNISKGKVTCGRCHDPHGDNANDSHLLKVAVDNDQACADCHAPWYVNNADALLTHPVGFDYAAVASARPNDFYAAVTNVASGDVRLVGGNVSCTSCHAPHYVDSNSTTVDGKANQTQINQNPTDGKLLRTDGELRTGPDRNTEVTGTAQLRSNLCQACHKIELHGQGVSGDHMIGCLECHGGHSYNGGTPSAFILRDVSPGPVPTRPDGVNGASVQVTFPNFPAGGSTRTKWADENNGTANGFCEKCHGDVNGGSLVGKATEHQVGNNNECSACHKHNDPANLYSFNRDATAATCGQCHGFPPYKNVPGDRVAVPANDGGYAINPATSPDPNVPYDYVNNTTHEKDETTTGHKVHAGRDLPTSPANTATNDWYFVGAAGIDNCKVCHGPDAGSTAGGHRIAPATRPNTFRDVPFDGIAKTGSMSPAYNINSPYTCTNVYCHTNGAPYNGASRPNRVYTFVNTTPPWVGNGTTYNNGGYGSIHGKAYECASCHGNDTTTMGAAQKQNSTAHLAHLGGATTLNLAKTFSCSVCHVESAASSTELTVNAMDGRVYGKHINGTVDVNFETGSTPNTLPEALTGSVYTAGTGVCSTYCHNVTGAGGAAVADWDVTSDMQCDSCHGGLASDSSGNGGYGPISTGSHARHVTSSVGPQLACAECHGTGSDAGTHAGHFDGQVNMKPPVDGVTFVNICDECHGYDGGAGEVQPVWGSAGTTDCYTCHGGAQTGANINGVGPDAVNYSRTSGHNRPTASGAYAVSANPAANRVCTSCHDGNATGHFGGGYDKRLLAGVTCVTCHGVGGSAANNGLNAHQGKNCEACHDPHGTSNVFMIHDDETRQATYDTTPATGFTGFVAFSALTGANSYDEDDAADGGVTESNADDICATCHTSGAGTLHNNSNNTDSQAPTGHQLGTNCFTCHKAHTDAAPFGAGAGNACNDCHGFPPNTAAHSKHAKSASNDKDVEDRTDCAFCHTGADLYTYDPGADVAAGGARGNHAAGQANRRVVLAASIGYETTNFSCATACHLSSAADGAWSDAGGLNCNACHYSASAPTGANNTAAGGRAVSAVHNEHFDKSKTCSACHDVAYSPAITAVAGPLTHITDKSGANEGLQYQGMAQALVDEAAVVRASMTFDDGLNTCSGGIGLGCHASGTPDWDVTIPATSAGCVMCHTETNSAAYNPTSGVHDNSPSGPTVTGNAHDGSFDDGSAGTADCVTCHTASPTGVAANHINATLNTGTAITVAAIAGYTQASGTCATTCHSAGTVWNYKWATSAYATNGTECANCHGDYASGWNTGVAPHTEFSTRGNKHNSTGTLTYPCSDCHGIGSAGYNWTSKWDPTGATSSHGDDKITMNQTAINTFAIDTAPNPDRAGCTTSSCHQNDAAHNFRITTTAFTTQTVAGNQPSILCSSCHGGYVGTNANGYWPDGANTAGDNAVEDNSGAHLKHMTALAQAKYGETLAQLLTDNGNGTADAKQKFLCAYCHTTPGSDVDHGIVANLPAEVNSMYALWDLTRSTPDNGVFDNVTNRTCATTDCHYNKTTPVSPTNFSWYGGQTGTCVMCHLDVTAQTVHTAHTGAAVTFGRTIGCAACHEAATSWAGNTAPATGHINGTYSIAGSVSFTYASNSCGINECHNDGKGGMPNTNPYPWNGGALANCSICHNDPPGGGSSVHGVHIASTSFVPGGCIECHPAATAATHIQAGATVQFASAVTAPATNAAYNGSCTNNCHLAGAGDWTGGPSAIGCTDCHSGAYVGGNNWRALGNNYLPQYVMHTVTPTVSGKVHTDTGLATTCDTCHSTITAQTTHINGVWTADDADNTNDQNRGMFAAFIDGSPATCATACHSAGTAWRYKWSATASATDGTQCANCHGEYTNGWTTGVGHAANPTRGNGAHTDAGTAGFPCTDCHSLGSSNGAYPYTVTTNDWRATDGGATTLHGDGLITMNSTGTSWTRNTGRSGCSACHEGATGTANAHDFAASALTSQTVAGVAPNVSGGCTTCHGDSGGGGYWPNGSAYPDRQGAHAEHVSAIAVKLGGDTVANRNASCDYCHPNPGEPGHNDNVTPATLHVSGGFKYIIGGAADSGSLYNGPTTDNCSNINCHGNAPFTPHWYPDTVPPAAIANLAVTNSGADVEPGTLKLTWTAPGNDNNVDGKAYEYDVRYSTGAINAGNFGAATRAGHAPTVSRMGKTETMHLEGLTPGTSYYVAVKTRDEVLTNWSAISNLPAAVAAKADAVVPTFWGIETATAGDETGTVELRWNPAVDTSLPITYKIWWSTGTINYGSAPNATTQGLSYRVTGLPVGVLYNFAVRAMDSAAAPNTETNIFTKSVMAKTTPAVPIVKTKYYTNSLQTGTAPNLSATLGGALASPQTGLSVAVNTAITWRTNTTYSRDTNVTGITYEFRVQDSGNNGQKITYQMGYCDSNGANFVGLGTAKDMNIGRRSNRVRKLPLNTFTGIIPAGKALSVKVTNTGVANQTWSWGTATTSQGILTVNEQPYNNLPGTFSLNQPSGSATVTLSWGTASDSDAGDTVHYDVYGSTDNGATWPHIIATSLAGTSTSWDTVAAGVALGVSNSQVRVKVAAGDGQQIGSGAGDSHTEVTSAAWTVNNTVDTTAPSAITNLDAETRPKQGSVYLTWTAPGDDGTAGRAQVYDVRYSTSAINAGNFTSATPAVGAPYPELSGKHEGFEIVGLTPATTYYFAVKAGDETPNWSAISNVVSTASGDKCGICHATPPDESGTAGNHIKHGYTVADCTKCHGDEVLSYSTDHQDGQLKFGFGRDAGGTKLPTVTATVAGSNVSYWQSGVKIYEDTTGAGGFNLTSGDGVDNGTCMGYNGVNASGCHGPATPQWDEAATLACSACHGTLGRTTDGYGRKYDDIMQNGSSAKVIASPPVDNHGNSTGKYVGQHEKHLNFSFRFSKGDSCRLCHKDNEHASGTADINLDLTAAGSSAIWTPNASGAGTPGTCAGTSQITCHGTATTPSWDSATTIYCNNCHGMNGKTYTIGGASSQIGHVSDGGQVRACTWCHVAGHPQDRPVLAVTKAATAAVTTANNHGLSTGDSIVMHVPNGMTQLDGWSGTVTVTSSTSFTIPVNTTAYSTFTSGFWTLGVDSGTLLIPNNSAVGIDYRSGGIHLLKTINGRGPYSTEAEICWGCHDAQATKVSEWGANNDANTGSTPYNYGLIGGSTTTAKWYATATTGASWSSAKFTYKTGTIQSTHSTNPDGSSAVSGSDFAKTETVDPVQKIRCSNCHDLHDRNLAPNDTVTGTPYLRGTWMGNPYEEDGAPLSTTTYTNVVVGSYGFGAVPRGGTGYRYLGGYFIDQNNAVPGTASATAHGTANFNPTASWTLDSSAGLCTLCHGTDIDNLDQTTGENLWVGTNGHSNSAIGGTFTNAANIFDNGAGTASISGRPTPTLNGTSASKTTQVPDMAYQTPPTGSSTRGYGYRGTTGGSNAGGYTPVTQTLYAYNGYDWGATVDASTIDVNFHNFSCSKCHNPHASRLPKLLITNCLDIKKNTWDDNKSVQSQYTAATLTDVDRFGGTGQRPAYYASAQNCHRYNNLRTAVNKGGWNKVSPW